MERIFFVTIIISLIATVLVVFSPWITEEFAEKRVITTFQNEQKGIIDGCGFNCDGCGVVQSDNILFGYKVEIEFACGLLPEDKKEYHEYREYFVSFLGTVHE